MKKRIIIPVVILAVIAALAIFFSLQSTPKNVLNAPRADALYAEGGVITVPDTYTVIGAEAFAGKIDFDTVIIEGSAVIEERAFYGCPNLERVELRQTCEIGDLAFASCPMLKTVEILSADTTSAETAFDDHNGITLEFPVGSPIEELARRMDMRYIVKEDQ